MDKKEKPKQRRPIDREKLADKVLDIFSDSPEDMAALIETLKKLEKNPLLHPEKNTDDKSQQAPKIKPEETTEKNNEK